jgi:uncharacterized Zn finger protein
LIGDLLLYEEEDFMIHCENCGKMTKPKIKPIRIIVEKREKVYYEDNDPEKKVIGKGWEIAKEMLVCKDCGGTK